MQTRPANDGVTPIVIEEVPNTTAPVTRLTPSASLPAPEKTAKDLLPESKTEHLVRDEESGDSVSIDARLKQQDVEAAVDLADEDGDTQNPEAPVHIEDEDTQNMEIDAAKLQRSLERLSNAEPTSKSAPSLNMVQKAGQYFLRAVEDFAPMIFFGTHAPTHPVIATMAKLGGGEGGVTFNDGFGVAGAALTTQEMGTLRAQLNAVGSGNTCKGIGLRSLKHGIPIVASFTMGYFTQEYIFEHCQRHPLMGSYLAGAIGLGIKAAFVVAWNRWCDNHNDRNVEKKENPQLHFLQEGMGYVFRIFNSILITESFGTIPRLISHHSTTHNEAILYLGVDQAIKGFRYVTHQTQPFKTLAIARHAEQKYQRMEDEITTSQMISTTLKRMGRSAIFMGMSFLTQFSLNKATNRQPDMNNVWARSEQGLEALLYMMVYEKLYDSYDSILDTFARCYLNCRSRFFSSASVSGTERLLPGNAAVNASGAAGVLSSEDARTPKSGERKISVTGMPSV